MTDGMIDTSPPTAFIRASNGDRLPIRVWLPPSPPTRVVVALHGMVTHAGWFAPLAAHLVGRGVALVAPDRRGNGHARKLAGAGDIDRLIADVADVVHHARTLGDVTLLSWCGSANFAVPAALTIPVQRLVLASPGLVPRAEMAARFRASVPFDGLLPIHFDPATDFTDDPAVQTMIRADPLYLRYLSVDVRAAWRELNPRARAALACLPIPVRGVLARMDRMIDLPHTVELFGDLPIDWLDGGHGFVVEPAGARRLAELL